MTEARIVLCTTPNAETSQTLACALVETKLAACVNIIPGIRSIYFWEGRVCDDSEQLLMIKTTAERISDVFAEIRRLHPYKVPEGIVLEIRDGPEPYLSWLSETVKR